MAGALEGVQVSGRVLAVGVSDEVLAALQATGAQVVPWTRFGPGATELPPPGPYDRVALRLPRGRRALEATLHVACADLAPEGRLWLYGANDEGIRSAGRTVGSVFAAVEVVDARKHGRVLQASGRGPVRPLDAFLQPVQAQVGDKTLAFDTLPGVFADGRLDAGTRHLLDHLQVAPGARVLDVGCGAGVIGLFLGPDVAWQGVDADAWALACARRALPDRPVELADVWPLQPGPWDHIVSNPPFHDGDRLDYRVLNALVAGAGSRLSTGGKLTFVAPITAPAKPALEAAFREIRLLSDDRSTRVWEAMGPVTPTRARR